MAKHPTRPRDPNQLAKRIADIVTCDVEDTGAPSEPKARGGRAGAAARAKSLTSEERKLIAQKAAAARWGNK